MNEYISCSSVCIACLRLFQLIYNSEIKVRSTEKNLMHFHSLITKIHTNDSATLFTFASNFFFEGFRYNP